MIIIVGSVTGTEDTIEELIESGLAHSRRSRLEAGCLAHQLTRDVENPLRLVFHERWADMAAVTTHFAVQASADFVRKAMSLSDLPPTLELFEATAV